MGEDEVELLDRDDESRLLMNTIMRLKPEFREVLLLREYEGLSYEEIAAVVGSTESTVKARLFKARQQLHKVLKPYLEKG
jgi:RNA polymerase sigma-70 factor, ECF subfamily